MIIRFLKCVLLTLFSIGLGLRIWITYTGIPSEHAKNPIPFITLILLILVLWVSIMDRWFEGDK